MTPESRDAVKARSCPTCGAGVGRRCTNRHRATRVHAARKARP